jgi:sugar phosphate isomerase/epimerase
MKLGFWEFEFHGDTNAELAEKAARLGYDGVDLRVARRDGRPSTLPSQLAVDSPDEDVAATRRAFETAGVEISSLLCYNTSPTTTDRAKWTAYEQELILHANLARRLGAKRIRPVVAAPENAETWNEYIDTAWRSIGRVLDQAPGVTAVLQNHNGRSGADQLFQAADRNRDERIGIEFSPDHVMVMQEDVFGLMRRNARHIRKVCLADRRVVQEGLARLEGGYYHVRFQSCPIGEGIVPFREIVFELVRQGFDGYVSLKGERSREAGTGPETIDATLAHFPGYMRQFNPFSGDRRPSVPAGRS